MVVSCCSMKEAIREALRLIPNEPAVKDKQMIFLIIFLHSFAARDSHFARASHASRFNWKAPKKITTVLHASRADTHGGFCAQVLL